MLFLIGMDKQAHLLMPLLTCECARCRQPTQWQLWQEQEKASLFFIPVWRFTADYVLLCEACGDNFKLPRAFGKSLLDEANRTDEAHRQIESLIGAHQSRSRIRP
ncbi:zinc-ribbon domain-containing protein [Shewanella sp. GXUN23E]|uniref:zinc-ribbon domain-containing protein n=1 Tax=Shewanella sp. GXUN23E TaxID=3422498 RepID=UPI003D7CA791